MKKYLLTILLIISLIWILPGSARAGDTLEQLRIANALINEANWGGDTKENMGKMAELLRNQYNEQRSRPGNESISYSDILFHSRKPGESTAFKNARDKLADKDENALKQMGQRANPDNWNEALSLAKRLTEGSLDTNLINGANAYGNGLFYKDSDVQTITPAFSSDNNTEQTNQNFSASQGAQQGTNKELSRDAEACSFESMEQIYMSDGEEKSCWYCKIVIVMVNAYLKMAAQAIDVASVPLGKIILTWGFLIWLAYYILQQVSSLNPITPGKMLQEILVMGFKVALAYSILGVGTTFIRDYYLNPIVGTGVDYGVAIFDGLKTGG